MYEEDDGEYPAYEEDEKPRRRKGKLFGGAALLTYALIGAGLAQTITLNENGRVEFGQGVYTLKACDSFISITLTPSEAIYSGIRADSVTVYTNASRVKSVIVFGLDTVKCAGKTVKVQVYALGSATPMNLFTDSGSLAVSRALFKVNSDVNTVRQNAVTFIDGYGDNQGYSDDYESLSYDANNGAYSLVFTYPLALVADVINVTIETANP